MPSLELMMFIRSSSSSQLNFLDGGIVLTFILRSLRNGFGVIRVGWIKSLCVMRVGSIPEIN